MGKAQSKRSVDITTETKKGTEDDITEKMEKIEDLDKKEVVNGDATISEKSDTEKKDTEEVDNDKDMSTEKDLDVRASGDAAEPQNIAETRKEDDTSATTEEISPLSDESIKKSKKEKVKKKWSFRSISFGKKDKQKPTKSEDAAEDGTATTNVADAEDKTNENEDTIKDKSTNVDNEKTKENHENGNSTPQELIGGDRNDDKPSDEKSTNNTANTVNNTTITETCAPVQNETLVVSSELSEKTERTSIINEPKISENVSVDDASKNFNGIDETINVTDQDQQQKDVKNTSVETPSDNISILATAVTNESTVTTNGEVFDQIHQNGDHGESEQEFVEKSKAQIEVNSKTDKVSAATLDSISFAFKNPSDIQIHAQYLNASSVKRDEINQIHKDESVIEEFTVTEANGSVDQSSLTENVSMVDIDSKINIQPESDLTSEVINSVKSVEEKHGIDPSPPPLPISPPPSQVSVFVFTSNEESVEDSVLSKNFEPTTNNRNKEENNELPPLINKLPLREVINNPDTIPIEKFDERNTSYEQALQIHAGDVNETAEIQCQDNIEVEDTSMIKYIIRDGEVPSASLFAESKLEEETSAAIVVAVIDEITEIAADIVSQQLKSNEEKIIQKLSSESNERKESYTKNENVVAECNDNKAQSEEGHVDIQDYVCEFSNSSNEYLPVIEKENNVTIECSLDFPTSDLQQQDKDEMNSLHKSDYLDEKHLDPTKEVATAKDIKDNVIVAEITQDFSVTCE